MNTFSPNAVRLLRMDQRQLRVLLHRYCPDLPSADKARLVRAVCCLLEAHLTLERDVFYPAVAGRCVDSTTMAHALSAHAGMARLVARIRAAVPADRCWEAMVAALSSKVLTHIADEQGDVLPKAERVLRDELNDLGARMLQRRFALSRPSGRTGSEASVQRPSRGSAYGALTVAAISTLLACIALRTLATKPERVAPRMGWVGA